MSVNLEDVYKILCILIIGEMVVYDHDEDEDSLHQVLNDRDLEI